MMLAARRVCRCNGCLMLSERIAADVISYWCPHMDKPGEIDIDRHLAWQKLNKVPDWLCKVKLISAMEEPA